MLTLAGFERFSVKTIATSTMVNKKQIKLTGKLTWREPDPTFPKMKITQKLNFSLVLGLDNMVPKQHIQQFWKKVFPNFPRRILEKS